MRIRKKELDVDFIGGVGPLTKAEEKRISEVIKKVRTVKSPSNTPTRKPGAKKKVAA
jgi:hypothetical protein